MALNFDDFVSSLLEKDRGVVDVTTNPNLAKIRERIYAVFGRVVQNTVTDVSDLVYCMNRCNAVVSGSTVLSVLFDNIYSKDIDWYVPISRRMQFLQFFKYLGYECTDVTSTVSYNIGVNTVHKLSKIGSPDMDIVTSSSESAIFPILHFHSTVVMNFFDARSLYIAYPRLLFERKNLINLNVCAVKEDVDKHPNQFISAYGRETRFGYFHLRTSAALNKYEHRGFRLQRDIVDGHNCFIADVCPHTVRSTIDDKGLWLDFEDNKYDAHSQKSIRVTYGGVLVWRLGGPSCISSSFATSCFVNQSTIDY